MTIARHSWAIFAGVLILANAISGPAISKSYGDIRDEIKAGIVVFVGDELVHGQDRLLERRLKKARFRDPDETLDDFDLDFGFAKKLNRKLLFELATARFVEKCDDVLFLGPPGTGKSHLIQAIGTAAIHQGHQVDYREAHRLIEELMDATLDERRKKHILELQTVPLLIIERIVQTADLLVQRWSIRGAQSKRGVGAGPVAAGTPGLLVYRVRDCNIDEVNKKWVHHFFI